jgi:hypothetical protein
MYFFQHAYRTPLLANRTFSLHGHEVVMRGAGSERRYTSKRAQWDFLAA